MGVSHVVPFDYVLLPGRHHLITGFQVQYLHQLLTGQLPDTTGDPIRCSPSAQVVWAVTSATHSGTRRNPLPAHRREAMIERVTTTEDLPSLVVPVADATPTPRFASTTLNTVEMTLGLGLTPHNTVVACSTPQVAAMYTALGFTIAGVEASTEPEPPRPWEVLEMLVAGDPSWQDLTHPQAVEYIARYRLADHITTIHTDPTVGAEGDLTDTRDYRAYVAAFDDGSDRKWDQVAPHVVPGKVVDLGCAAGGLLERAAQDPRLVESDLFGVDVSRHLVAEAEHRKAQGVFANPNIWFAQRNLLRGPVFPDRSVNTTISVALTHEIASYGNGRADLEQLAARIFDHTAPGGVWVNADVLGPDDPDQMVHLVFDDPIQGWAHPGVDMTGWDRDKVHDHVASLTHPERLVQFARDFPALSGGDFHAQWLVEDDGAAYRAELSLRAAMEYLTRRDYTHNWLSECHERFCDMTWADWVDLVTSVGFEVAPASGPWTNQWLVDNRFSHRTRLVDPAAGQDLPWPHTHLLLIARRPR